MKKISSIIWATALIGMFLLSSCQSSLTKEAKGVAQQYLESRYIKCGDSHYSMFEYVGGERDFSQYRGLTIKVKSHNLTEADKANGIEWKGEFVTNCRIYRGTFGGKDWGQWQSCVPSSEPIIRIGGRWFRSSHGWSPEFPLDSYPTLELTCEDMSR